MTKRQFTLIETKVHAFRQAEQQVTNARELRHLQGVSSTRNGRAARFRISPKLDSVGFYGALDVESGQQVALSLPGMSGANTVHFLQDVLDCLPTDSNCVGSRIMAQRPGPSFH